MHRTTGSLLLLFAFALQAAPPRATISNGLVKATLDLPDGEHGAYRGARFDWSGVIESLQFAGHTFFGPWSVQIDPTAHDNISGPVEEFTSDEGALGFAEAKPRDLFVKIGVGVLRKPDARRYQFSRGYQVVGNGVWVARPSADRVEFEQTLRGDFGYNYVYRKTVRLVPRKPELILEHTLKNTGKRPIYSEVYNHDFFVLDNKPTGPAVHVLFHFEPKAVDRMEGPAVIDGQQITYSRVLHEGGESAHAFLTGYGGSKADNDLRVENESAGIGVRQFGDFPISKLHFWSVRTTVCPEIYKKLQIAPGKTVRWKIHYVFYELPAKKEG